MITVTKFHGFFYEFFDKTETPLSFSAYVVQPNFLNLI
jgi:hypothetical protein